MLKSQNLARAKELITNEKGMNAEWEEIEANKLVKVTSKDGTIFFIEIEGKGKLEKNATVDISLGFGKNNQLKEFSGKFENAPYNEQWVEKGIIDEGHLSFEAAFKQATDRVLTSGGRIKFDLTKFDFERARQSRGKGLYDEGVGYTEWEFNQIIGDQKLINITDFYRDGIQVPTKQVISESN